MPDEVRCVEMTMKHVGDTDEKIAAKTQMEKSLCPNVLAVQMLSFGHLDLEFI